MGPLRKCLGKKVINTLFNKSELCGSLVEEVGEENEEVERGKKTRQEAGTERRGE